MRIFVVVTLLCALAHQCVTGPRGPCGPIDDPCWAREREAIALIPVVRELIEKGTFGDMRGKHYDAFSVAFEWLRIVRDAEKMGATGPC